MINITSYHKLEGKLRWLKSIECSIVFEFITVS